MSVRKEIQDMHANVAKEIIGQSEIIERLIIGILANGNLLVESLPGLAKTRAIKALSNNVEGDFSRIQFTPDLVSRDITGQEVYVEGAPGERGMHKFEPGPIFNNLILADEVNRAPPKTQNALLEAMEERQVTVSGKTHKVPDLFMVLATMNPATQEGTFPMPEAQMDRFLMHIMVDYPDEAAEAKIIQLVRKEFAQENKKKDIHADSRKVTSQETIFAARSEIDTIPVPDHVEKYIVDLIFATRYPQRYTYELKSWIAFGCSPRASLALDRVSRAHAWLNGQDRVEIENIQQMMPSVFRHRMQRGERAIDHNVSPSDICEEIMELVPVPKEGEKVEESAKAEIAKAPEPNAEAS